MTETTPEIASLVDLLKQHKAEDIVVLDVQGTAQFTDCMIICTGRSKPHVHALAKHLRTYVKAQKLPLLSMDGATDSEWVLVDLGDIVVHIMRADTRAFYQIEALWASVAS